MASMSQRQLMMELVHDRPTSNAMTAGETQLTTISPNLTPMCIQIFMTSGKIHCGEWCSPVSDPRGFSRVSETVYKPVNFSLTTVTALLTWIHRSIPGFPTTSLSLSLMSWPFKDVLKLYVRAHERVACFFTDAIPICFQLSPSSTTMPRNSQLCSTETLRYKVMFGSFIMSLPFRARC